MMAVTRNRLIDVLWLVMLSLTLGGSFLGENADPGIGVALFVVVTMAFKGRMVIDHFMELKDANPRLRMAMRLYFWVLPLVTLFVYMFGDLVARLTAI